MGQPFMSAWQLFVDEAGDCGNPYETFFVGGILVPNHPTHGWHEQLKARLHQASEGLPWPPHANRLRIPAILVDGHLRGAPGNHVTGQLVEAVRASSDPTLLTWRNAVANRDGETDLQLLKAVDDWLACHHSSLRNQLETHLLRIRGQLLTVLQEIDGAVVVGGFDPAGHEEEDRIQRYLRTYQAMFERVAWLLNPHDLLVIYPLEFDSIPQSELEKTALAIKPENDLADYHQSPQKFRPGVHPGLVLADMVANAVRHHLIGSWDEVRNRIRHAIGLGIEGIAFRDGGVRLPALAAEGPPRTWLHGRLQQSGVAVPAWDDARIRWTYEQASRWATAFGARP